MSAIRGIIFDKDGTLFDFASTWESWAASFIERIAIDPAHAKILAQSVGFDLLSRTFHADSIVIAGTPSEVADALLVHIEDLTKNALLDILNQEAETAPQMEAVPLAPFLSGLRADGYLLGVATNDAERPARAHLNTAGVEGLFDFIAGFDSGFGAKPEAGQLIAFADATGLQPQEVVMVGDSTHDLIAGRRAGMACVGVLTGLADSLTLSPYADAVFQDIGELPRALQGGTLSSLNG